MKGLFFSRIRSPYQATITLSGRDNYLVRF